MSVHYIQFLLRAIKFLEIGVLVAFPMMYFLTDIPRDFLIIMFIVIYQLVGKLKFHYMVGFVAAAVDHIVSHVGKATAKLDIIKSKVSKLNSNNNNTSLKGTESELDSIKDELDAVMESLTDLDID